MLQLLASLMKALRRRRIELVQRARWFRDEVKVARGSFVAKDVTIGRRTRINAASHLDPCSIGPYCAVGGRLVVRSANHHHEFLNVQEDAQTRVIGARSVLKAPDRWVRIGAGVWIGDDVKILENVEIGDGAVIGAGAVVTTSIPAYAIAAGVPARVIRMRYPEPVVELLSGLDWWNWSDEKLRANKDLFETDLTTVDPAALARRLAEVRE